MLQLSRRSVATAWNGGGAKNTCKGVKVTDLYLSLSSRSRCAKTLNNLVKRLQLAGGLRDEV